VNPLAEMASKVSEEHSLDLGGGAEGKNKDPFQNFINVNKPEGLSNQELRRKDEDNIENE
jgi:hypothetical protein